MYLIAICIVGFLVLIFGLVRIKQQRGKRELEAYSIEPEALHQLMDERSDVLLFDVRQPLDLLAHSEIIPGAKRIAPKELLENVSLIPKERDSVVYCTCPSEDTSRRVLREALKLQFSRIKFLKGGLTAWKERGFPVERYEKPFHLDTAV